MDLTSLTIGGLGGGIIGASLAAVLVGGLARGKQIDEAQEEVRHAVGGLDADGTSQGSAGGDLGGNRVCSAHGGNYLRGAEPGAAAEVEQLRQQIRKLKANLARRDAQLEELREYVSAWARNCEGLAFVAVEAGPDVASLQRSGGAT